MGLLRSVVSRIRDGLAKTRETLVSSLRTLLGGRTLDEGLIAEIEAQLIRSDVGVAATARLIDAIRADYRSGKLTRGEDVLEHLKREVKAFWPEHDRRLRIDDAAHATQSPGSIGSDHAGRSLAVIVVTGVNGAGKTTSIAKLASRLKGEGRTVMLAACDTFRAGAVKQLEVWGERLGVEVVKGQQGGDPAAVAFDACKAATSRGVDVLIVDTAGRLQTQDPLMRQLGKIHSVIARSVPGAPHETLLVLDATTGQNALRQIEEFTKAAPVTGIILSKLDGTARGGIVVAIKAATDIPVKLVGIGERPEDMEAFDPESFVEALFAA